MWILLCLRSALLLWDMCCPSELKSHRCGWPHQFEVGKAREADLLCRSVQAAPNTIGGA